MLVLWLTLSIGCMGGKTLSSIDKPPMPVPGERQAEAVALPDGRVGIWEPTWSEANGLEYMLQLEKKAKQDDILIDALQKRD